MVGKSDPQWVKPPVGQAQKHLIRFRWTLSILPKNEADGNRNLYACFPRCLLKSALDIRGRRLAITYQAGQNYSSGPTEHRSPTVAIP